MRVLVVHSDTESRDRWARALAARLPGARVLRWPDAHEAAAAANAPAAAPTHAREPAEASGMPRATATRATEPRTPAPDLPDPAAPAGPVDYAVGWNPPADFFDLASVSKAFFSTGAGVDHLLRHPGLPASLPLIRLENAGMGAQMAEYCCHEVLRVYRRTADYERQQRDGVWRELEPLPREQFSVGILGMGVLGSQVAQALRRFGFPVSGYSRSARATEGVECFSGADALPRFLGGCTVLILLAPLTPQTEGLINRDRLAMLPRGAWLVNVARGGLVVDRDLLEALDEGRLAGATLDVFRVEPLPAEHAFWRHPKIRMTPHVSAMTLVDESAEQVAGKIRAIERGEAAGGVVDRARGY